METPRIQNFTDLKNHAWYGKLFKKLTAMELGHVIHFLYEHKDLSTDDFCGMVLRQNYQAEFKKSKNILIIDEMLLVSANKER